MIFSILRRKRCRPQVLTIGLIKYLNLTNNTALLLSTSWYSFFNYTIHSPDKRGFRDIGCANAPQRAMIRCHRSSAVCTIHPNGTGMSSSAGHRVCFSSSMKIPLKTKRAWCPLFHVAVMKTINMLDAVLSCNIRGYIVDLSPD